MLFGLLLGVGTCVLLLANAGWSNWVWAVVLLTTPSAVGGFLFARAMETMGEAPTGAPAYEEDPQG